MLAADFSAFGPGDSDCQLHSGGKTCMLRQILHRPDPAFSESGCATHRLANRPSRRWLWHDSCSWLGCRPELSGVARNEGDSNVSSAVCCFAADVAAGTVRVPRCRWVDPSSVSHCGDFVGGAFLQAPRHGLRAEHVRQLAVPAVTVFAASGTSLAAPKKSSVRRRHGAVQRPPAAFVSLSSGTESL